jgi:ABC-type multidrug transport system ATPase subunit
MTELLSVENLTKRFARVVANDRITFGVAAGEIHCLFGENGAGKSTLSACLYGYHQPDSGRILSMDPITRKFVTKATDRPGWLSLSIACRIIAIEPWLTYATHSAKPGVISGKAVR